MKKLAEYFVETEQAVAEKAVSQQQQKFMGMVHAMQKGEKIKGASPELKKVARTMKKSDVKDFAKTKHKGLPKKVDEQAIDEDAVQDFLARGGKIEYGKTHKPRKSEKWQGSSHIGAAGGKGTKGRVSGLGANTNPKGGKPVVTADIHTESALMQGVRQVTEARLIAESGVSLDHIVKRFKHEVKNFVENGDMDDDLYHALFDYYFDAGEMPYGVAKARSGDPYEWISERFYRDLEEEGLVEAADPLEIPAYKRKHNARLGNFPAPVAPKIDTVGKVRPENIPAVQRKAAGKDFPVSLDQVHDTSDKISHLDTLRKMAGLPPRA